MLAGTASLVLDPGARLPDNWSGGVVRRGYVNGARCSGAPAQFLVGFSAAECCISFSRVLFVLCCDACEVTARFWLPKEQRGQ